ncbi:DUF4998 domain-containing protein [Hufsiella ginkgonis]|uniref:DUF5013 domain-containing protein n=1 Tax=Hufsiella ginkgonis TaxID=2695274 RepID=A0A7K1Y0C6_9SPHI|nr:DUF4998 domain-containing protein [Hufsiella ginkgonis]MXV16459.1 DUF5013 domain-containing protein [Hufsiella ginkgonis]
MKLIANNKVLVFLLVILMAGITSCTKMDDFKKYVKDGEISYTGRVDSLKILPGRNRVLVKGLFISDPKVTTCKIYWNSRKDSLVVPVVRTTKTDTLKQLIPNLQEGTYNFEVITYDKLKNASIVVRATANVYGDRYAASLINKPTADVELADNGTTTINWGGLDKTGGAQFTRLTYTLTSNATGTVKVLPAAEQTLLPNYKYGSTFRYRTAYLPDTASIDTFYTDFREVSAKTNVTATYIKNASIPMAPTSDAGVSVTTAGTAVRWRKLADWTSNAAANNWGVAPTNAGYGTWVERGTPLAGTMSMEAGKNTTTGLTITNGKIYQTATLPAGSYTMETVVGNMAVASPGACYFVAVIGTDLPNIGSASLTTPKSTLTATGDAAYLSFTTIATQTINFTLTSQQTVTFGFVATLIGTSTTNQYLKINSVKMKYLKP